jgi:hypothetical protein
MIQCSACSAENSDSSRFCSTCGARLHGSYLGTVSSTEKRKPVTPPGGESKFATGTVLSDRYRIVGLLGKGGMGEVYRADDLKLEQTVALKFLPDRLAIKPDALSRFHREVRIARQITHPNICRVFDIGEVDGMHFLSMEYIDGEDLASLLRRIGRLPSDKAVEIARDLCAGLNAAHEIGVLHRDLKPANIMLDGRGKAHITDFGLAGLAEEFTQGEIQIGTPAYMAPEQLTGKGVTAQSDIYSLGLVLYEIFTGKRLFDAATLPDLIRQHDEKTPTIPDTVSTEMDPAVERVILRCLENDPRSRPQSVAQVFAALPGGDPLAAALAAGETPSPELIAASGKEGALQPRQALACLAAVIVGLVVLLLISGDLKWHNFVRMDKSPAVLADRAKTVVRNLGYVNPPVDIAFGFDLKKDYILYLQKRKQIGSNWQSLIATGEPLTYYFWYRQSPHPLIPKDSAEVSYEDPPAQEPGMIDLSLDPGGRLVEFRAVPPREMNEAAATEPDWKSLFLAAGIDIKQFTATEPRWTPPVFADQHFAWAGTYPDHPDLSIRVEAAAFGGRPTYFQIVAPWTNPGDKEQNSLNEKIESFLFMVAIIAGAFLAYRNLKTKRGDWKGAMRVGFFSFSILLVADLISGHYTGNFVAMLNIFFVGVQKALLSAAEIWLFYIALEPYVRRLWPSLMISWSRLLAGNYRDPMVGRDVLIGCLFGTGQMATGLLIEWTRLKYGTHGSSIMMNWLPVDLGSVSLFLGDLLRGVYYGMLTGLFWLLLLLTSFAVFRRRRVAIAITWVLLTFLFGLTTSSGGALYWTFSMGVATLMVICISRFGPLTTAAYMACISTVAASPVTSDFSRWYAVNGLIALVAVFALALVSARISLAGQPLMRSSLFPD